MRYEPSSIAGARRRRAPAIEQFGKPVAGALPTIIRAYKSAVTYAINETRGVRGVPVWQRNYYEHIVRNNADHERIYKYIQANVIQGAKNQENPEGDPRSNDIDQAI